MYDLKKYHFHGQKPGEIILQVVRRHWFNILLQYLPLFFLTILFVLGASIIPQLFPYEFPEFEHVFWFFVSFIFMFIWLYASLIWVDYYLDVWIITNRRVVNVEQKGLFLRTVSELRYERIQDVTTEVTGILPTFLNYGDVYVQTAGKRTRFLFHAIPDPYKMKSRLMALQKKRKTQDLGELEHMIRKSR